MVRYCVGVRTKLADRNNPVSSTSTQLVSTNSAALTTSLITLEGKPDSLSNCTILNQTSETLHVECLEGFNGGLQQFFVMEVFDALTRKLVSNVTSRFPVFLVGGLESGVGFEVQLYAVNKKGRSSTVQLQATTLKSAEKHTGWWGGSVEGHVKPESRP